MGRTVVLGIGWGIPLPKNGYKKLSKHIVQIVSELDDAHPFIESPWYTLKPDELELVDTLEDFYEDIVEVHSSGNYNYEPEQLILASSTTTSDYSFTAIRLGDTLPEPTKKERKTIEEFAKVLKVKPSWFVFAVSD